MPDEALLSELCSICYTNKPKYRCPGCKTQTCSLPCYKRHQQRASCTGKRDPTVFVKRSQLATPAGIDQDYNYLKGVEREIDHASRETLDRGVGGKATRKGVGRGQHPESILQRYCSTNRITIQRAPTGMSRQKTNQTRSSKSQQIMWTVEWVDAEGQRDLQDDCLASSSLHELYRLLSVQKKNRHASALKAKRKLEDPHGGHARKASKLQQDPETHVMNEGIKAADKVERASDSVQLQLSTQSRDDPKEHTSPDPAMQPAESCETESTDRVQGETGERPQTTSFYLLKPGTTSASKVLIPLDSEASLTASLQGRTVLEYPTIYALPHLPDSLPPTYLLEKHYTRIRKGEEDELNEAIRQAGPAVVTGGLEDQDSNAANDTKIDPQKILDMLKRNVTR